MKLKKLNSFLLALSLVSSVTAFNAVAAIEGQEGSGQITFTGSIIDAPCSIAPNATNQVVDLGAISNALLQNAGASTPRNFTIDLEKCDISTKKSVVVTFAGAKDSVDPKLLGVSGSAKGAGIVLTDGSGAPIDLFVGSAARQLLAGDNKLVFSAYLKANSSAEGAVVTPGEFTSIVTFQLSYL